MPISWDQFLQYPINIVIHLQKTILKQVKEETEDKVKYDTEIVKILASAKGRCPLLGK